MNVEMWPIERPTPYAKNPRKVTPEAIDKVASSLKEFGWQACIVVDDAGVILAGHTRLLAAQKLGMTHVPVKTASGLTKGQQKAFRLADNRVAQETRHDTELLALELRELEDEFSFDLSLTGFDQNELNAFLATDPGALDRPEDPFSESSPDAEPRREEMRSIKLTTEQHEVVGRAIMAIRISENDSTISDGRALELIAADYLAGTPYASQDEPNES